jgi:lycopene beta-cyclase
VSGQVDQQLVIVGGGLAGCLAALALARLRPEVPVLLVEQDNSFGGNHIWSFFDDDVAAADRWLVDPFVARRWDGYEVRFPARRRTLPTGYNSSRSELLDAHVRQSLQPDQYRLGAAVTQLRADHIVADGARIDALAVIDARGAGDFDGIELGWQKFVGREYRLAEPHLLDRPIVMDACVDQSDGYRFVYCLPFTETALLVEDTYYSTDPSLDRSMLAARIDRYVQGRGWQPVAVEREEAGILPVAIRGSIENLWPANDRVPRLGLRGGFFHPTTGYSLPDAVRTARLVAEQRDFGALGARLRTEATRLWRERRFYRLLNRMLFRAAAPDQRYRVLEHFYRLDPDLIARFYAGRSSGWDKMRILSGRPPVPVGRALKALRA